MQTNTRVEVPQQLGAQAAIAEPAERPAGGRQTAGLQTAGLQGAEPQGAALQSIATEFGSVRVNLASLLLGELLVSDEGAELEVVGLDPLAVVLAPEEEEDWGE